LQFHVDYFKGEGEYKAKPGEAIAQAAVAEAILSKHDAATSGRRFNAVLATASINDAIAYTHLFKTIQARKAATEEDFVPLNIACVFSPPAEGNKDVQQLQEDLLQEKADNKVSPEEKKIALKGIIADYNAQFGTNHTITEFDQYYQDVQQRIKDHKYTNKDYPAKNKIDLMIVVDMLLTGFDSKYLNTLYVDKNLKYHGLIQAFSRTNRILNDSKPYGTIMDFRSQQAAVDEAIELFSGEKTDQAREIWLVEPAPVVIQQYEAAVNDLQQFMQHEGLECKPEEVNNLKGDIARAGFIEKFKEVQRLKTQLDQYTDLPPEAEEKIEALLPTDDLRSFRSQYLETAKRLKEIQDKDADDIDPKVQQLDFNFVLFASATIDYDYIMGLIARNMQRAPDKQKMTMDQIINMLSSTANLMDEREDLIAYIKSVDFRSGKTEDEIKKGYEDFKEAKHNAALAAIAQQHGLEIKALKAFVAGILNRMIFDGEQLNDLLAPLDLGWKARSQKEQELMTALIPELNKLAGGREISGLNAYE
jgi:type I restriction enzyme R subunit